MTLRTRASRGALAVALLCGLAAGPARAVDPLRTTHPLRLDAKAAMFGTRGSEAKPKTFHFDDEDFVAACLEREPRKAEHLAVEFLCGSYTTGVVSIVDDAEGTATTVGTLALDEPQILTTRDAGARTRRMRAHARLSLVCTPTDGSLGLYLFGVLEARFEEQSGSECLGKAKLRGSGVFDRVEGQANTGGVIEKGRAKVREPSEVAGTAPPG